jgi:hypothetical protein
VHTVEELAVSGKAPFEPANWNIAGAAALDGKIPAVSVTGYAVVPVRLRVRMDLKYLSRLLAACANADLPFEIQGLRFEAPSRLTEVEKPKPKTTNRPHFGAFGAAKQAAEKKKEDEPEKPQSTVGRGELVELWGNLYIGQETDFEALLKQQQPAGPVASAPAAGAVAASPAGQP